MTSKQANIKSEKVLKLSPFPLPFGEGRGVHREHLLVAGPALTMTRCHKISVNPIFSAKFCGIWSPQNSTGNRGFHQQKG